MFASFASVSSFDRRAKITESIGRQIVDRGSFYSRALLSALVVANTSVNLFDLLMKAKIRPSPLTIANRLTLYPMKHRYPLLPVELVGCLLRAIVPSVTIVSYWQKKHSYSKKTPNQS